MDVYRALNVDVPQLLYTVTHQAGPTVTGEEYNRTATALQRNIREQAQKISEELQLWLKQQYGEEAEETARKLQMLGLLPAGVDLKQVQQALTRDYTRLGNRLGSSSMVGLQGSGEQVFSEEMPADPDLAKFVAGGREYLASLDLHPGQGIMHETWLLFRGSINYDVMEHVVRDRMGIYSSAHGDHLQNVGRATFGTYNLVYQLGESLTSDLSSDSAMQEVTFAFSKGPVHYSPFRQEVSALMEHVAEQVDLRHASFWQRKLGLGSGKEFSLRLRLPAGEATLKEAIGVIADAGRVGKETIVNDGKLLLGMRVM